MGVPIHQSGVQVSVTQEDGAILTGTPPEAQNMGTSSTGIFSCCEEGKEGEVEGDLRDVIDGACRKMLHA